MSTLSEWTSNSTRSLMSKLPGHTHEAIGSLVEGWLVVNGGWSPDIPDDPSGEGAPLNGESAIEAADAIAAARIVQTETIEVTVPIIIKVKRMGNYPAGTSETVKLDTVKADIESMINAIATEDDAVELISYTWGSSTISTRAGGALSEGERVTVGANVAAADTLDPAAAATHAARAANALSVLWVANQIYVSAVGEPIYVTVDKYIDAGFSTIDDAEQNRYIVRLDPITHVVQSLVKLPKTD